MWTYIIRARKDLTRRDKKQKEKNKLATIYTWLITLLVLPLLQLYY